MRKRWLVLMSVALLLVAGVGVVAMLLRPGPGVSRTNFEKIRPGMPKGEVEGLLGGPARDCVRGANGYWQRLPLPLEYFLKPDLESQLESGRWVGPDATVVVCFDGSGRVLVATFQERTQLPLLDRLRAWLGL